MQDRVTHLQAQKQEDDYAFFRLLISLIQLLIWPSVVIVLALLFHNPISQWIRTLEVKLSTILGELKAKPQTLKELNARVEEEADTYQVTEQDVRTAHLLALERIEREFGGNMRPNVLIHGTPFDAVTWGSWRGRVIAIEVEFVGNEHAKVSSQIPQLVSGANAVAQKYNRNVFSLVLAFVTIDINEKALREKQAEWQQEANDSSDIRVFVRVYDYQTLRAEGSGSSSK
ncbi:hypothetical protein [Nitrosovibrio sp. Nv4]|uniref:hypothetical protein n=1 Tax=Nitrosovibrio sp. Nv4 TaxID=1945880 RepID=UPI000BE23B9F|nr:hypothetical protein [Nitrosovibrio sp. Nv4]